MGLRGGGAEGQQVLICLAGEARRLAPHGFVKLLHAFFRSPTHLAPLSIQADEVRNGRCLAP